MKWTKWTEELIRETAKKCPNVRHFHHYYRGAEKAAKRMGILDSLFENKEHHNKPYTFDELKKLAFSYTKRSEFQLNHPSAYNAAKHLNILSDLFPIQLNKKISFEELKLRASKYTSRSDFENGDSNGYQVAQKRGIIDEICPPKMQGVSKAEKELLAWLQTLSADFKTLRFKNDYELDAYSDSLKLGIEYNGHYFHSESTGKSSTYHLKKTKYFEALGIRVIHIWEYEWRDRQEQVKDFIRSACGKNTIRIGARKCDFKEIASAEARTFLNDTHIQGAPSQTKYAVGCFYNGALVGVCSFGTHHRGGEGVVLNRFACAPNYTISGFLAKASKLALLYFKQPISSWAHIAKSQGRGYLAAGWTVDKILPPDYFYSDTQGKYISKQSRKKSAVGTPSDMTESEHAKNDGLYKIWDCGKIRLVFKQAA